MIILAISAIKGIYRNGKIEPLENIPYTENKEVVIVFLGDIKKDDVVWEECVAKDFLKGYSVKDEAYDKL